MQERFEKLQQQRYRMLRKMYEETGGDTRSGVDFTELARAEGLTDDEAALAEQYLTGEGLIEGITLMHVGITHAGVREIEQSLQNPGNATEHFPPVTFNFHGPVGAVQSGAHSVSHVTQNVTSNSDVRVLLQQLRDHAHGAPPEKRQDATELVDAIEAEVESGKPQRSKLKAFFNEFKSLLGSPIAVAVVAELAKKVFGE